MPFDVTFRQTTELAWGEDLTCPKCARRWDVEVHALGQGTGTAKLGIGQQGARERAGFEAFANAAENGKALVRRAQCPACGHRQEAFWSLTGVGGGFLLGCACASGLVSALPRSGGVALVVFAVVWFVVARFDRRRNERFADACVVFRRRP